MQPFAGFLPATVVQLCTWCKSRFAEGVNRLGKSGANASENAKVEKIATMRFPIPTLEIAMIVAMIVGW